MDVEPTNSFLTQRLISAVTEGRLEEVRSLISGIDITHNPELLQIAVQSKNKEIIELLVQHGADINASNTNGETALHFTTLNNSSEIANELLRLGADINATDKNGRTALHLASKNNYWRILLTLLENGSDINIIDKNNETALEFATDTDNNCINITDPILRERVTVTQSVALTDIILKDHIFKMKAANLYLNSNNLRSINGYGKQNVEDKCKAELDRMKNENIADTTISYHDILIRNEEQLAKYAKSENIVDVLTSTDYKTQFPIYYHMIKNNFKKGMERKELLEKANKFIVFSKLPYECTENIISYLSNADLRQF